MAIPKTDSLLVTYAALFSAAVNADHATYNIPAPVAAALVTASGNFTDAYNLQQTPGMKSPSTTTGKNAARAFLLEKLRPVYAQISALDTISDQ